MSFKITNIVGANALECKCRSWLEHWERFTREKAKRCFVEGCNETNDLIGGYVKWASPFALNRYVIPFCKAHNAKPESQKLEISDSARFKAVPATVLETCRIQHPEEEAHL
jgi:hypothetical protein